MAEAIAAMTSKTGDDKALVAGEEGGAGGGGVSLGKGAWDCDTNTGGWAAGTLGLPVLQQGLTDPGSILACLTCHALLTKVHVQRPAAAGRDWPHRARLHGGLALPTHSA